MVIPGLSFEQTMINLSLKCYIPSFKAIGLVVLEKKIFEGFLPYMGMVAILAKRPKPFEQIFNISLPGCCIWNLIEIGPAVSEEKLFEKVDNADDRRWITVYTISSPGAFGSGELKNVEEILQLRPLCYWEQFPLVLNDLFLIILYNIKITH